MKKVIKKIAIIITIIAFAAAATYTAMIFIVFSSSSNSTDNTSPEKKSEMLKLTLKWGRLSPIPESKSKFNIETEGGSFTRSFRSSFYLRKTDIDKWVKSSPGLADAEVQNIDSTKKKYIIKPGAGANYAEAVIDREKGFIEIYVSWS
ncbi:MAG TPA: hypothetical protein VF941_08445 [Clostridia bacterium]